jgi:hypothetical protein
VHPKLSFKPNCFIPAKSCDFTPRSTVLQNYKTPYQRRKNKLNDGLICANINQDEYTCLLVLSENHSATSFYFILQKHAIRPALDITRQRMFSGGFRKTLRFKFASAVKFLDDNQHSL